MFVLQYWHFQMTCLPLIFLGILHVNVFNVGLPKDLKKFWELESRTTWYQQRPILSETCWQFLFCEGANPTFNCGASHHASVIENTSAWNPPRIHEQICRAAYRCVSTEMALNHSVTWKSHMKLLDIQFLTSICQFWEPFHLCVLVLAYPVLWGKQKFEILTIQFPLCSSSSTLQTRILRFCSTYRPGHFHSYSNDRMNQMLRCACVNTVFSKTIAREKVLEVLAWSFQALSSSAKNIWFSFEAKECTTHDQRSCYVLCIHWTYLVWGKGEYPSLDPWGNSFSEKHDPHRFRLAGTKISYFGILEGIQCDQDYLRILFNLQVGPSRQSCCHYCDAIQWVSNRAPIGPQNNPESLYTVFGPREGDATTPNLSFSIFVQYDSILAAIPYNGTWTKRICFGTQKKLWKTSV